MNNPLLKRPARLLDGLADRVFSVLGAVSLSQFPQFYAQYIQRLGGHLDEAKSVVEKYIEAAAQLGLTLEEYIKEHLESASEVFISTGRIIESLIERYHELEQSYTALTEATIAGRWFVFLREVDWTIAQATWDNFVPGVPFHLEGLIYALIGLFAGWGLYSLIKKLAAFPFKGALSNRRASKKEQQ